MIIPMTENMHTYLREQRISYSDEGDGSMMVTASADFVLSFQQEFIQEVSIVSLRLISREKWEVRFEIL